MTIIILKEKLIKHLKEIKSLCIMKSLYMYGEDFTAIDRGKLLLIIIRSLRTHIVSKRRVLAKVQYFIYFLHYQRKYATIY